MKTRDRIRIIEGVPSTADYKRLNTLVGWGMYKNFNVAEVALKNTLFSVMAIDGDSVVGMGRIVGDGAIFFYLQDIVVAPDYQRQGIGTAIMDALVAWLDEHAPAKAYISLFTGCDKAAFYERYGFKGPESFLYGMAMKKRATKRARKKATAAKKAAAKSARSKPAAKAGRKKAA
jgi:ribosomal protein S18 acetylase RimI-like enzyme